MIDEEYMTNRYKKRGAVFAKVRPKIVF